MRVEKISYARLAISNSASLMNASRQIGNGNTTEPSPRCAAIDRTNQHSRGHHVVQTFAIVGDKGVPVDETADSIGNSIGHTCNDHSTVTVTEEHDVR